MEPESSLPYSQEPFTGPYSEPDQSSLVHTTPSCLSKIFSPTRATTPARLIFLDLLILIILGEEYNCCNIQVFKNFC
jgi:hypothetical protein